MKWYGLLVGVILLFSPFFLLFWFVYHSWMDLLTRFFPRSRFRRYAAECWITSWDKSLLYQRLKRSGFSSMPEGGGELFFPGGVRRKWLKRFGRDLRIRVQPAGRGYAVRLEKEACNRLRPVAPLTALTRWRYWLFLREITSFSWKRYYFASLSALLRLLPSVQFLVCAIFTGLLLSLVGFLAEPSIEGLYNGRVSGQPEPVIAQGFYIDFMDEHPFLGFLITSMATGIFLSFFTLSIPVAKTVPRWTWRNRKVTLPLISLGLFLFLFWVGSAEMKLERLRKEVLSSPWIVKAMAQVPSDELKAFRERWEPEMRESYFGMYPVSMDEWNRALIGTYQMDNFENFVSDFQQLASGPIFVPRKEELPDDPSKLDLFFDIKAVRLLQNATILILARGFEEVRSGNIESGFSLLESAITIQKRVFHYPHKSSQHYSFYLEGSINSMHARLLIGLDDLHPSQSFLGDSLSPVELLQWDVADNIHTNLYKRPSRFYGMFHDWFTNRLGFFLQEIYSTQIHRRKIWDENEVPFPPFIWRIMEAMAVSTVSTMMDQAQQLYEEMEICALDEVVPELFYEEETYDHLNLFWARNQLTLYQFMLDNRIILKIVIAAAKFREAEGVLPNSIDEMIPEFLPEVPKSFRTGEPIQYELSGEYLSLGWPGEDKENEGFRWMRIHRQLPQEVPAPPEILKTERKGDSPFAPLVE